MIRPDNYYASLEQRISYAVTHTADPRQLSLLIAETELTLAAAPDPRAYVRCWLISNNSTPSSCRRAMTEPGQPMTVELDQAADDLTGQMFGDLTAQHPLPRAAQPSWLCECVCGNRLAVTTENLLNGNKTKCANNCALGGRRHGCTATFATAAQPPGLEHSIAACLQGGDIAADQAGRTDCRHPHRHQPSQRCRRSSPRPCL